MNLIVSRNRLLLVYILSGRESRFCWCYQHWSHTMKCFDTVEIIFPVWKVHDRTESHRIGYSVNTAVMQYRQRYRQLQRYSSSEIGFTCIPSRWIRRKRGQRWCCLMWRTRWSNKKSTWIGFIWDKNTKICRRVKMRFPLMWINLAGGELQALAFSSSLSRILSVVAVMFWYVMNSTN